MPPTRFPAISWNAATWSVPAAVPVCVMAYSLIRYFMPHEAASQHPSLAIVCLLVAVTAVLLGVFGKNPRMRGIAVGIFFVPFVLSAIHWGLE
ncbi:hypothetical protein Srot_0645 [Segniliparus rotundus DSM 44985]|uniref:Uncharacterized protein n=1 Tax=Segniliparus rotundus (strain ATCC BAA-972 / CDC 1076 / CIP 108378 / DSM 44985 / JCM 13578) TaxID=640132 RepID=D6ZCT5_SEGRD|nr:hypothetical protein [Segniliparus rotundus]ADG97127.1 hypothetical protein Srot_0645 [Segniliparus rotundus DSM 44985]